MFDTPLAECPKCGFRNEWLMPRWPRCATSLIRAPERGGAVATSASTAQEERSPLRKLVDRLAKRKVWPILVPVVVALAILAISPPIKLRCTRAKVNGPVDSTRQMRVLGIVPLAPSIFRDVRGARVAESSDPDYGMSYRVELATEGGYQPLTPVFTSGRIAKYEAAQKVNAFVGYPGAGTLDVMEPGLLSGENLLCMAAWIPIWLGVSCLWPRIKAVLKGESVEPGIQADGRDG